MANDKRSFIDTFLPAAEAVSKETGLPTNFLLGQAAHETGWGKSLPKNADGSSSNNLFGIKAGKGWTGGVAQAKTFEFEGGQRVNKVEPFRSYADPAESMRDWAKLITRGRYAAVPNAKTPEEFGSALQRAGYATDPNYANLTASTIRSVEKMRGEASTAPVAASPAAPVVPVAKDPSGAFYGERSLPKAGAGADPIDPKLRKQEADRKTVLEGLGNTFQAANLALQDSFVANVAREMAMRNDGPDTSEWFKSQDIRDVLSKASASEREYLLGSISRTHFYGRQQALEDKKARQDELGGLGKWAMPGYFAGAVLSDPLSLAYAVPGIGTLALVSKTSRLRNALATGAAWGGAAAGVESLNPAPLKKPEDVIYAGLFGATLGFGFGAITNPAKAWANRYIRKADDESGGTTTRATTTEDIKADADATETLRLGWNGVLHNGFEGWNGTRFSTRDQWIKHFNDIDERIKAGGAKADPDPVTPDPVTPDPVTPDPVTPDPVKPTDRADGYLGLRSTQAFASEVEKEVGGILRMAHSDHEAGEKLAAVRQKFADIFEYTSTGMLTGINTSAARKLGISLETASTLGNNADILAKYGLATRDDVETAIGAYVSSRAGKASAIEDKLWAFRRGKAPMKSSDVLKYLSGDTEWLPGGIKWAQKNPTLAGLAKRLQSLGDRLNDVDVHLFNDTDKLDVAGSRSPHYDYANNRIMIPARMMDNPSLAQNTMLHEIAHAQTWHKLYQWSVNPHLFPEGEALYNELNRLRKAALSEWEKKVGVDVASKPNYDAGIHYPSYYMSGFSKEDFYANNEFIAGLFSGSKEFLEFLDSVPYAGTQTLASRIWEVIASALGLTKKDGTALAELSRLVDKTLDMPMTVGVIDPLATRAVPMEQMATSFQPHLGVPMATAQAAQSAGVGTTYGLGLGLENRLLGSKWAAKMQPVRDLASKLFGTTVGYLDHSVVGANAWDHVTHLRNTWGSKVHVSVKKNFGEFAQGVPLSGRSKAYEDFNDQVWDYVHGFQAASGTHHPAVVAHGDEIRRLLDNDIREAINNPSIHYGGTNRSLVARQIKDPVTGAVTWEGELALNDKYFPRKHDNVKWENVVATKGRQAVEDFYSGAFKSANPGTSQEAADKFGKWYVKQVESARINKDQDMITGLLQGHDLDALKDSLIDFGGMSSVDADTIIKNITRTTGDDRGNLTSNLKRRNLIDESYASADGLTLKDFVDTNATRVMQGYIQRQAGAVSAAHHMGVFRQQDWKKALADATSPGLGSGIPGHVVEEFRKHLQFAFDRIMGVPVEDPSTIGKIMEMFRNFNVIRLMGGAVFNQTSEMAQIVGSLGLQTTTKAVGQYNVLKAAMKAGAATDELRFFQGLFDDVGATLGERLDFSDTDDWVRLRGQNDTFTKSLDSLDNKLRRGASGLLHYTGMTPLLNWQRKVHSVGFINHIMDIARTGKESALFSKNRLAWMGMSEQDFTKLTATLKKLDGDPKMWEKLEKSEPELMAKLLTATRRESRRVVQENDLASAIPIMGKGAAQTFFQFQNFSFQAWNKAMLHGMHQRDSVAFLQVAYGTMLSSLVYTARTHVASLGLPQEKREEFMEKRLDPKAMFIGGGLLRIPQASLLPQVLGAALPMDWLQGAKTTSDITSIFSSPTLQAVGTIGSLVKDPMKAALSDEYQISDKDIRNYSRLIPFNNFLGMSTIGNFLGQSFPGSNTE